MARSSVRGSRRSRPEPCAGMTKNEREVNNSCNVRMLGDDKALATGWRKYAPWIVRCGGGRYHRRGCCSRRTTRERRRAARRRLRTTTAARPLKSARAGKDDHDQRTNTTTTAPPNPRMRRPRRPSSGPTCPSKGMTCARAPIGSRSD